MPANDIPQLVARLRSLAESWCRHCGHAETDHETVEYRGEKSRRCTRKFDHDRCPCRAFSAYVTPREAAMALARDLDFAIDVTEPQEVRLRRFAEIIGPSLGARRVVAPPREADAALWPLVERWQRAENAWMSAQEPDGQAYEPAGLWEERVELFDALLAYRPPSAPAPAMTAWRPIETAPKPDPWAHRLLLFYPVKGHRVQPTVLLGLYEPDAAEQPTHWQPIPSPPPPETQP